jgi:2-methylcitrate dehydratase PrpD
MAHVEPTHDANDVMSNSIVARLAGKICDFDKAALTKNALAQAKARILDTIGVTLAGLPEPCTQVFLRTPGVATAPGLSLIFGTNRRTSALDATLVNGIASHALDDPSGTAGGHHPGPLVSMLFALAEERKGRGDDLIAAYVIGTETETRLARAVNFHDPDSRHPISMPGTLAAAAAACHFLKLGRERMATALVIAASLASGSRAELGALTKPLHAGQCARNGLLAALLAEQGFDAAADAFEHLEGFDNVDVERLFADWIASLEIGAAWGDNPMNYSESWDKFEDYAARALPREQSCAV